MLKIILPIIIVLLIPNFIRCKNPTSQNKPDIINQDTIFIINDSLVNKAFKFNLTKLNLLEYKFLLTNHKILTNKHNNEVRDTILTFEKNNDKIVLYKTNENSFVTSAVIHSPINFLNTYLNIESDTRILENAIKIQIPDSVVLRLADEEEYGFLFITIKDNKIKKVELNYYFD